MDPLDWISPALDGLDRDRLRRRLRSHAGAQQPVLRLNGREVLSFASNDYLGLAADPRLAAAAAAELGESGVGAGASPLIVGRANAHARLESRLAEFEGRPAALLFPTGFAANMGIVPALVGRGDTVFGDALNHASIIDGCRLSRAEVCVYPHADVDALRALLSERRTGRRLIVTDSIFSMDGDAAPLADIADLARRHNAMLMLDEAHATGVFGDAGRGLAERLGVEDAVAVHVGTLSKALGAAGGFVCGSGELIDWLVNKARAYVFSTAGPPAVAAAAIAALDIVRDEPHRRRELLANASALRIALVEQGWHVGLSVCQIVPLMVGEAGRAMEISAQLERRGLLVPAIRPPSVPPGESRLRIGLTYSHTADMRQQLIEALAEVGKALGFPG